MTNFRWETPIWEIKLKPSYDNQDRELNSPIRGIANAIKIDEQFSNYFLKSLMAIEDAEVANDFTKEKKNEMIECLVQEEEDEALNYYLVIPRWQ